MRFLRRWSAICPAVLAGALAPAVHAEGGLSGVMHVRNFVVQAGTTRVVTGDFRVVASGKIEILGSLLLSPGAVVQLHASGLLLIGRHGKVAPVPTGLRGLFGQPPGRPAGAGPDVYCYGQNQKKPRCQATENSFTDEYTGENVVVDGSIAAGPLLAPNGKPLTHGRVVAERRWGVTVATPADGEVWVMGSIRAGDGFDANKAQFGGANGGQIRLGGFFGPDKKVTIGPDAVVLAGDGGKGWSETRGEMRGTTNACKIRNLARDSSAYLLVQGTDGGDGGSLRIWAKAISIASKDVKPGNGGDGGNAGPIYGVLKAPDGAADHSGTNVEARSGSGGTGGSVDVRYAKGYAGASSTPGRGGAIAPGRGGNAGSLAVAAGNGAPNCAGGRTIVTVGSRGDAGKSNAEGQASAGRAKPGSLLLQGGGNGGAADDDKHNAGEGGSVSIAAYELASIDIADYADGGAGFDGCANKPFTGGTSGGFAGHAPVIGFTPPSHFAITRSFNQGNAGDGNPPGHHFTIAGTPLKGAQATDSFQAGKAGHECFTPAIVAPNLTRHAKTKAADYACVGGEFALFDNSNGDPVSNNGTEPTFSTDGDPYCVLFVITYHWNDGQGSAPGTISLVSKSGSLGKWKATGSNGQATQQYTDGVPNANWTAKPPPGKPVVIDGTYKCVDSDEATWSQNAKPKSFGHGFCKVWVQQAKPVG